MSHLRTILAGRSTLRVSVSTIVVCAAVYGLAMGSFGPHRLQPVYSAVKVPMLLGVTFALAVPGFYMFNTLAGLGGDYKKSLRAVAGGQAAVAVVLASLAPFTALCDVSTADYPTALLFNGMMFAVATAAGQVVVRRSYRGLIAADPRHRTMLRVWSVVYCFIAIQMAWVPRPFVGDPGGPAAFLRPTAWGNAYVVVGELVWNQVRRMI